MDAAAPVPNVVDFHGRLLDPSSGNILGDGQEGPGSIFHVPPTQDTNLSQPRLFTGENVSITFSQMMEQMRRQGLDGDVFMNVTPRPEDVDRVPSPPPKLSGHTEYGVEISTGSIYRTECAYCWAIVRGKEREKGFTLHEIDQAAGKGCSTCNVLQSGIRKFANLIFPKYSSERTRIRQKDNGKSMLLSETKTVAVTFDEYDGETIQLTFNGSVERPTSGATWDSRIEETSSWAATMLIRDWLRTCSEEHHQCAIPAVSPLPVRVLEVSHCRVRLIETQGLVAPYVTLSHCWGRKPVIRLIKSNLEAMKGDIPWASLSKTFQDAIMVTWKLAFRYIWIDSLCILQDSAEDWEYHASKMAPIYSNSQLTISASGAADGATGCFSSRLQEPYICHSDNSRVVKDPLLWIPHELEGRDREGCWKTFTVRLKTPHGLYQNRRPKEPLLKRAWVFQEQILSPRIIHFASGELYFECRSHVTCECSGWSLRSNSYQWETRWRKAHKILLDQGIQPSTTSGGDKMALKRNEFEAYQALIETYTELDISVELDRLPALSGVTFGRKDEYLAGMWRSLLIESLHWYPAPKLLSNIMARRTFAYRAPTWSWASIEAPIRHLEKDFYKRQWSPKYVAEIIDASTTLKGLDPRGQVTGGYLRIKGPRGVARVVAIGVGERQGDKTEDMLETMRQINAHAVDASLLAHGSREKELCTYATIRVGDKEGRCYLDLPLCLARAEPAEVVVGQDVTCLIISTKTTLVLRPVPDTPGCYTRVGLFVPREKGWSFENIESSIFII